ncbi:hypothetical protein HIM_01900 [Hirsutella minnesotensis 3608]|nr:hypothetical protein HIM_01900 [Hirsutella minnesotensis 3608]
MSRNDASSWRRDDRDRASERYRRPSPRRGPSPPAMHDTWRPSDDRRDRSDRRREHDSYAPAGPSRSGDSWRPRPPQGDFTFRVENPPGVGSVSFSPVSRPPAGGRRGDRRNARGRPGRPRWQPPPHPSERALVSSNTFTMPGERLHDPDAAAKFRNLDELSDDEEIDMDMSESSQSGTDTPAPKRARTQAPTASAEALPTWSNPDPYTALPCPDESTRKKKDMVKLIRKARVEETKPNTDAPPKAENFISFDLSSDEESDSQDTPPKSAPLPPLTLPPRPPSPIQAERMNSVARNNVNTGGSKASAIIIYDSDGEVAKKRESDPLGSRKRTHDDVIKPPNYGQLKKSTTKPSRGTLVPAWQPKKNENPCPWNDPASYSVKDMAVRLHMEILDFYEFVRPRDYEQRIRETLVDNLLKAMKRDGRNFASAQIKPFGSFMSGLYLPTADMDLVVCSASFMRGGPPTYLSAKSWLYKFQKFLVAQKVADSESIEVIAHARIPLVKFVDKLTGLKVDVSFENLGGVNAVDTFLRWKSDYPAMPIIVTVIKHFLLMRGLNEPVNGGIGGFSVICLVVSMLQLMPQVQSRSIIAEHHLGELLLEFFDLYGRHFQYQTNAISLKKPVGYIRKEEVSSFAYKNMNRLSIIDPNNAANDISGGSSNTPAIMAQFHEALIILRERMREIADHPERGGILDVILRGDYSSFRMQRSYLKHIHEQTIGPCSD